MRARRVSSTSGKTHRAWARSQNKLKVLRFLGLHLGGGKSDRTSLVILDYYENQKKLFLTQVYEHIQSENELSSDQVLFEIIKEHAGESFESLSLDAPLKFPKCVTCKLVCPGYEKCKEPEIVWMWKQQKNIKKKKPRSKIFTPYTQRVVEYFINTEYGDHLPTLETFGANTAPLTARAYFLLKRFKKIKALEVFPSLSVSRISQSLKISKSHYQHYRHQVGGDESRQIILDQIINKDSVFIYHQDYNRLIHSLDSFEAFICALTGFLKYKGSCEKPPHDMPIKQGWIEIPKGLEG